MAIIYYRQSCVSLLISTRCTVWALRLHSVLRASCFDCERELSRFERVERSKEKANDIKLASIWEVLPGRPSIRALTCCYVLVSLTEVNGGVCHYSPEPLDYPRSRTKRRRLYCYFIIIPRNTEQGATLLNIAT